MILQVFRLEPVFLFVCVFTVSFRPDGFSFVAWEFVLRLKMRPQGLKSFLIFFFGGGGTLHLDTNYNEFSVPSHYNGLSNAIQASIQV